MIGKISGQHDSVKWNRLLGQKSGTQGATEHLRGASSPPQALGSTPVPTPKPIHPGFTWLSAPTLLPVHFEGSGIRKKIVALCNQTMSDDESQDDVMVGDVIEALIKKQEEMALTATQNTDYMAGFREVANVFGLYNQELQYIMDELGKLGVVIKQNTTTPPAKPQFRTRLDLPKLKSHVEYWVQQVDGDFEDVSAPTGSLLPVPLNQARTDLAKVIGNKAAADSATNAIKFPEALKGFLTDISAEVEAGRTSPMIGRTEELDAVVQTLLETFSNNPALLGDPGVGKSQLVVGLARAIQEGKYPELTGKRIVRLDTGDAEAGTSLRGQFSEKIKALKTFLGEHPEIILFIDEAHSMVGTGSAGGSNDLANLLKPLLGGKKSQVIIATTLQEYTKHIEKDGALVRRFSPIVLEEPNAADALTILSGVVESELKKSHNAHYPLPVQEAIINLGRIYIHDRYDPDRSIKIADKAGAIARFESNRLGYPVNQEVTVQLSHVWKALEVLAKLPKGFVSHHKENIMNAEQILNQSIFGQPEAVATVASMIQRQRNEHLPPQNPASAIFIGSSGVGKTELAKALQRLLTGNEEDLVRLNMGDFQEKHTVARFIGAPPGYIGYNDEGQLTGPVRQNPYRVILLDEIEKAHPEVTNALLSILDDGHMTDAKGRVVSFKHCIVIMTSNLGAKEVRQLLEKSSLGFVQTSAQEKGVEARRKQKEKVLNAFSPEFLNRLTHDVVFFNDLNAEDKSNIVGLKLQSTLQRLESNRQFKVHLTNPSELLGQLSQWAMPEAPATQGQAAKSPKMDIHQGGRQMDRILDKIFETPLRNFLFQQRALIQELTQRGEAVPIEITLVHPNTPEARIEFAIPQPEPMVISA